MPPKRSGLVHRAGNHTHNTRRAQPYTQPRVQHELANVQRSSPRVAATDFNTNLQNLLLTDHSVSYHLLNLMHGDNLQNLNMVGNIIGRDDPAFTFLSQVVHATCDLERDILASQGHEQADDVDARHNASTSTPAAQNYNRQLVAIICEMQRDARAAHLREA